MADRPTKKRATSASASASGSASVRKRAAAAPRAPEPQLETQAPEPEVETSANYALQLTEALDDAVVGSSRKGWSSGRAKRAKPAAAPIPIDVAPSDDTFALRLNEALNAIAAAEGPSPVAEGGDAAPSSEQVEAVRLGVAAAASPTSGVAKWLASLDKLPPIRLPVGPPIPWRFGLPALLAVIVVTMIVGRPTSRADAQAVHLPAQETYAVQQEAPLFANSAQAAQQNQAQAQAQLAAPAAQQNQAEAQAQPAAPAAAAPTAAQPLGVQDPGGMGFDVLDLGLKLAAVLGLAYGSLMLLKRVGVGGVPGLGKPSGPLQGVQVLSSIALAPNRSVHVIRVPGGRTLLVGSTPSAVNLLADLGEVSEVPTLSS